MELLERSNISGSFGVQICFTSITLVTHLSFPFLDPLILSYVIFYSSCQHYKNIKKSFYNCGTNLANFICAKLKPNLGSFQRQHYLNSEFQQVTVILHCYASFEKMSLICASLLTSLRQDWVLLTEVHAEITT